MVGPTNIVKSWPTADSVEFCFHSISSHVLRTGKDPNAVLVFAPIIAAVDWSGWVGGATNGPRPESLALQPSQQFRLRAFPRWRQRRRQAVRIPRCDLSFRGPIKVLTELASPNPHVELSGLKRPKFAGYQQFRRLAFGTTRGPQRPTAGGECNARLGSCHSTDCLFRAVCRR